MDLYRVHGLTRSYFTRKVTGYLDYSGRGWTLEPGVMDHPEAIAAGWEGGIPVVVNPDGVAMWDSTSIIEHLNGLAIDPGDSVLPEDSTLAFLAYLLDDFSDEWFYRPAVGSRWSYPANTTTSGWQLAEEISTASAVSGAFAQEMLTGVMTASLPKLGVTPDNIETWMDDVYVAWLQVLQTHFEGSQYLLGDRPCIADFALFGANAAHFVADPYCRELADEHGPNVVAHTSRLLIPRRQIFGEWLDVDSIPETLIAVIAQAGRHYLPWVAAATVSGSARVELSPGVFAEIESTPFLDRARGIMLARYVQARTPELDAILERAEVLSYFADFTDQATSVPDVTAPPQPTDNRPYAVT